MHLSPEDHKGETTAVNDCSLINTSNLVNASKHTRCVSLNNQKCKTYPNLINLHPNDLSNSVCVPNKTENWNIHAFNMITGKN